jgi:hypothetical protein
MAVVVALVLLWIALAGPSEPSLVNIRRLWPAAPRAPQCRLHSARPGHRGGAGARAEPA